MKKTFTLILAMFFVGIYAINAQIARKNVVVESNTSVLWSYCPGAAIGLHDLYTNGKQVAIIEYHNTLQGADPYANSIGSSFYSAYAPGGNPAAFFDGKNKESGGMASGSMYSYYLPKYNTAIAVQSPVDISISLIRNTATTYTATVTVTKAQTTVPALTLKTALTQSNISYNWQNQTKLYWVERTMYPSFTGTTVTFTGNTFTYTANIDLGTWGGNVANGDWEFVAFVQQSDKTISQGEMVNLKDAGYVGIDEVANKNVDLKFYPNPVEEKGVVVTNFDSKNEVIMKINNILGEEVFNKNIGKTVYGNMYDINTANLPAGMYILNMFVDDQIVTKKIQVQ